MKLSDWQAKLRNATPPLAPEPKPLAPLRPVVVVDSPALGDSFEVVLALTDSSARPEVLRRLAIGGYEGMDLKIAQDRNVLKDTITFKYWLDGDAEHPPTMLAARIEPRSAELDKPCARLTVPPRRPSKMYELMGRVIERFDDHDIIARFIADARQFGAWPFGCYVANVRGSSASAGGVIQGELTTADGRSLERFRITTGGGVIVTCNAWPLATAEVSAHVLEEWSLGR